MGKYNVLGIMSGSSMDGTDLAMCEFELVDGKWSYIIKEAITYPMEEKWRIRLSKLRSQTALTYARTNIFYAYYLSDLVKDFIEKTGIAPQLVGSHGHTIFHYPDELITTAIGDGATLAAKLDLPVVTDFRTADVALEGEGAPLVGVVDELLFSEYDYCINLGGFANISTNLNGHRIAYDVCASNILLNRIARDRGKKFDEDGEIAEAGHINTEMLERLNAIEFFRQDYPKSLNRDWINKEVWSIIKDYSNVSSEDKMKTLIDHIAQQIGLSIKALNTQNKTEHKVLFTGGGAYNNVLMEHIKMHTDAEVIIPDNNIVDFKESMAFGLLGLLRVLNTKNVFATTTGSLRDHISGSLNGNFSAFI